MKKLLTVFSIFVLISVPTLSFAGPHVATDSSNTLVAQMLHNSNKIYKSTSVATDASNSLIVQKLNQKDNSVCLFKPTVATDASNTLAHQRLSHCKKS